MKTVTIIGFGRLGSALLHALPRTNYRIEHLIVSNDPLGSDEIRPTVSGIELETLDSIKTLDSDLIFISTQDDRIKGVVRKLVGRVASGAFVFHTSGSRSSNILEPLSESGCNVGSIHPLVSIVSDPVDANQFAGAYFCIEGEIGALKVAESIVSDLSGLPFTIPTDKKTLYHAAAVFASGHLIALIDGAKELMVECGIPSDEAIKILLPLVQSAVFNISRLPASKALTGTFARADETTFRQHLAALSDRPSTDLTDIYLLLARRSLGLALENGADRNAVEKISAEISVALKKNE